MRIELNRQQSRHLDQAIERQLRPPGEPDQTASNIET